MNNHKFVAKDFNFHPFTPYPTKREGETDCHPESLYKVREKLLTHYKGKCVRVAASQNVDLSSPHIGTLKFVFIGQDCTYELLPVNGTVHWQERWVGWLDVRTGNVVQELPEAYTERRDTDAPDYELDVKLFDQAKVYCYSQTRYIVSMPEAQNETDLEVVLAESGYSVLPISSNVKRSRAWKRIKEDFAFDYLPLLARVAYLKVRKELEKSGKLKL